MLKYQIRKFARKAAGWPVIGRFIRIGVAVIRLPEERDLWRSGGAHRGVPSELAQRAFDTQQLPTLLSNMSEINHRQIQNDVAHENLVLSVPVALRALTRDLADVRARLDALTASMDKSGAGATSSATLAQNSATVLNVEKIKAARLGELRINLAYGQPVMDAYVNVGEPGQAGVDIVADAHRLPFSQGEVDEIVCSHVLQRFSEKRLRGEILPHFLSLLKSGAHLRVVVCDAQALARQYAAGTLSHDQYSRHIHGAQRNEKDVNLSTFNAQQLEELLIEAGFRNVQVVAREKESGHELEVTAEK